ncbi:MAG: tRNA pseudouridine(38-40) synthase TruA [Candidatus Cloacimonadota bacterium]|nr:MAG: tRNA pseudouridine(38-40) synthase TruA [Candidatus Cloacimonadota bacterium]
MIMEKKFKLNISYDGSEYYGWQIQKHERTVQGELENALQKIYKEKIILYGSGRTDRGVHAFNQYAHFSVCTRMNEKNVILALNSLLPKSIYIKNCQIVDSNFHARFSAKKKKYVYKIRKQYSPFWRNYALFLSPSKSNLNSDLIKEASKYLVGEHNFWVFSKTNLYIKNYICNIYNVEWQENEEFFHFSIVGNRFLYNMVRRIVGTLLKISEKNLSEKYIEQIFEMQDKRMIGEKVAPNGLYLAEVYY